MKSSKLGISIITLIMVFVSCQPGLLFEETTSIPIDGWDQDNILSYTIPVEDTNNQYDISLIVRNEARYEYSNLFLFINTTAPSGQGIRDTVEIRMANEEGKWFGRGIGGKYTLQVPYKSQVMFPRPGSYRIEIEQGMRDTNLDYITDIGIIITKL